MSRRSRYLEMSTVEPTSRVRRKGIIRPHTRPVLDLSIGAAAAYRCWELILTLVTGDAPPRAPTGLPHTPPICDDGGGGVMGKVQGSAEELIGMTKLPLARRQSDMDVAPGA